MKSMKSKCNSNQPQPECKKLKLIDELSNIEYVIEVGEEDYNRAFEVNMQPSTSEIKVNTGKMKLKRKCKNYCAEEKLNILKELDKNVSINELARQYDVDTRTIRNWRQNRSKLEKLYRNNSKLQRKRQRKLPFHTIEKALFIWFEEMRLRSIPLNGPLLQAKALELAREMNISEKFVASEGWLSNWKVRNDIQSLTICNERMNADVEAEEKIKKEPEQNIGEDLMLAQIFNAEIGLNYKMLPSRTLPGLKECQTSEFKQRRDCVTIMVCSNVDGSLKLPLVIIGKSANPRKLKNIPKNVLPVYYTSQKSTWMDSNIFEKWFKEEFVPRVSAFLKEKNLPLKAVLYLDNVHCHLSVKTLSVNDIKVYYLPNTTSPMDRSIMETLKRRYRSQLLFCASNAQKNGIDIVTFLKSISLKDIVYWISDVWIALDPAMIRKCWEKLLVKFEYDNENNLTFNCEADMTDDLLNDIHQLNNYQNVILDVMQDWVMEYDNYYFTSMPSNSEIIQMVTEDSESENENESEEENVTPQEAISAADKLISFYEKNALLKVDEFSILRKCKNIAIKLNIK